MLIYPWTREGNMKREWRTRGSERSCLRKHPRNPAACPEKRAKRERERRKGRSRSCKKDLTRITSIVIGRTHIVPRHHRLRTLHNGLSERYTRSETSFVCKRNALSITQKIPGEKSAAAAAHFEDKTGLRRRRGLLAPSRRRTRIRLWPRP